MFSRSNFLVYVSGFLLATQNHHEWRIGNVIFSFNTAIWLISLDEGYDSEAIMFTVMNSMVWCSQKAKQEPKAESFVVLSKHNEDIHIAYVDMGSTWYYFAKEIFEHNLEKEFEIWCLKANGQNFATLFNCDGVVLNTNERHFLLVGTKWRILEWKVMKILLYQCQSKSISMPWIFTGKHVISCSGSVWDGMRCNRWIASNDLLTEKRRLLTTVESRHKYDHIRPRAKWRKASESAYPTNALGSIVLLLSLFKVLINNMVMVTYVSCNLLH